MSDKSYTTRECERRAQKAYRDRLKTSEKDSDQAKWADMQEKSKARYRVCIEKMRTDPDKKGSLERYKERQRVYAQKVYADPERNAARNRRRRELRAEKKKLNEINISVSTNVTKIKDEV